MEEDDSEDEEDSNIEIEEKESPHIRSLLFSDFELAKEENSASVHEDAYSISELRKWNEMYGAGGKGGGKRLTYFL